jgi:hypothetical protein
VSSSGGQLVFFHMASAGSLSIAPLSNNGTLSVDPEAHRTAHAEKHSTDGTNTAGSTINSSNSTATNSNTASSEVHMTRRCNTGVTAAIVHTALSATELSILCLFANNQLASFYLDSDSTKRTADREDTLSAATTFHFHAAPIISINHCFIGVS